MIESKTCERCGTVFTRTPGMRPNLWAKKRFCTQQCSARVPWRRVDRPFKVCEECDSKYQPVDRAHYKKQRFCSRKCHKQQVSRLAQAKWERRTCLICRASFRVRPGYDPRTCADPECIHRYKVEFVGPKQAETIRKQFADGTRTPAGGYSKLEENVWQHLRSLGWLWRLKWREDGGWIELDLALLEAKLNVELDGREHTFPKRRARDEARDAELTRRGWKILRIPNADVDASPEDVAKRILIWAEG